MCIIYNYNHFRRRHNIMPYTFRAYGSLVRCPGAVSDVFNEKKNVTSVLIWIYFDACFPVNKYTKHLSYPMNIVHVRDFVFTCYRNYIFIANLYTVSRLLIFCAMCTRLSVVWLFLHHTNITDSGSAGDYKISTFFLTKKIVTEHCDDKYFAIYLKI